MSAFSLRACNCAGFVALALSLSAGSAHAAIMHGDFDDVPPGTVMFLDVTESSVTDPLPPARFGEPEAIGNTLDFDPSNFGAVSAGGPTDFTDVQLNLDLMAVPGQAITEVVIQEDGDFTILPTAPNGPSNLVAAALTATIDIFEIDGVELAVPISITLEDEFAESTGPDLFLGDTWSNQVEFDLVAALEDEGIQFLGGVTKAELVLDNTLVASGPDAFIAKKDFSISTDTRPIIPEPVSLSLVGAAIAMAGLRRNRFG